MKFLNNTICLHHIDWKDEKQWPGMWEMIQSKVVVNVRSNIRWIVTEDVAIKVAIIVRTVKNDLYEYE